MSRLGGIMAASVEIRRQGTAGLAVNYRKAALARNLEFAISVEEAAELMLKPCHYCGLSESDHYNGIDRMDNSKGYVPGNIVPCCRWCNWAKGRRKIEDFRAWLKWVASSPTVWLDPTASERAEKPIRKHRVLRMNRVLASMKSAG